MIMAVVGQDAINCVEQFIHREWLWDEAIRSAIGGHVFGGGVSRE